MDYVEEQINKLGSFEIDTEIVPGADSYRVDGKLFAIYVKDKTPKRLSLRGDTQLVKQLRERYESVVQPANLDIKTWNTYILTEQLDTDFITSMIIHSYISSGGEY
ncbi:TPA: hypothetical protein EYO12_04205 [Candidatus Saccharibacteria bacterium]|nr:hypothetical protein [Candidatus Saccharibacteria bacterium]HIO87762.1 hypothetical protein [Candidatus Saccharibacteria bacterium]